MGTTRIRTFGDRGAEGGDPASNRLFGVGLLDDVVDEAVGRGHRHDPATARSGGPAGNARLTSWVGLFLLGLLAGELLTLLNVTGLMSWHVGLGIALVGLSLLKTGSTGWRIVRYYAGSPAYRSAGPPPTLLRLLGPLVIAATLGVLGSGIVLVAEGPDKSRSAAFTVLGHPASLVTLHQGFFFLFAGFAGLHLLARLLPALSLVTGRPRRPRHQDGRVPGGTVRAAALVATAVAAAVAAVLVVPAASGWHRDRGFDHFRHGLPNAGGLSRADISGPQKSR